MRVLIAFVSGLLAAIVLTGCCGGGSRAAHDVEHVEETLAEYRDDPSPAAAADVDAAFARLDARIAAMRAEALREDEDDRAEIETEIAELEARRTALRRESVEAGMKAAGVAAGAAAGDALRSIGESLGKQLEEAGRKLREAASGNPPPANE